MDNKDIILDSNVWISLLNKSDSLHKKASFIFEKIRKSTVLPEYVALEVSSILLMRIGKKEADDFLTMALDSQDVDILPSNYTFFINIVNKFKDLNSDKLSFVDVALLYLSDSYKIITFDKSLEKIIKSK